MSIEIEAKMRLSDAAGLEARLRELSAADHGQIVETNTFFDTYEGQLKTSDQGLRVRVEDRGAGERSITITHKGPRAHGRLKSRSETEVKVGDARDAAELLTALGFQPVLTFEKRRRRFELDGCHIELDTLPHLGNYVEIEGPTDEAVYAVREKLGLADQPLIRTSYIALMMTYLDEHHVQTRHVRFEPKTNGQPAGAAQG